MEQNMWQKCPVCEGSGRISAEFLNRTLEECPTCKGERIISTLTGRPPDPPVKTISVKDLIERTTVTVEDLTQKEQKLTEQ